MKKISKLKKTITMIVTMVITISMLSFVTATTTAEAPNYSSPFPALFVQAHVQNDGWQNPVIEIMGDRNTPSKGITVGTTGRALRLECLRIGIVNFPVGGGGIEVNAHLAGTGWTGFKRTSMTNTIDVGTTGESRAIEAVQIRLTGMLKRYYSVEYKLHLADKGWTNMCRNGQTCGTTGEARRSEALYIRIY